MKGIGRGRKAYLTIDFLIEEFKKRNYVLLSEEYINNRDKLKYKCLKHPEEEQYITWDSFKKGSHCSFCALESRSNKRKLSFETVKSEFTKRGYILLDEEYINAKQLLKYQCPKHPDKILRITISNLKNGRGCIHCSGKEKLKYEYVKEEFEKRNYILIDTEYINTKTKLKYKCPKHLDKEQSILFHNLLKGEGCLFCGKERFGKNQIGENNPSWKGGVTPLNKFLRNSTKHWKRKILKKYDYKCFITGENSKKLEIHHTIPFYMMRDDVLNSLNLPIYQTVEEYTQEELESIVSNFNEFHESIEGVPLKKEIHTIFHSIYGKGYTSFEELLEFKENYLKSI